MREMNQAWGSWDMDQVLLVPYSRKAAKKNKKLMKNFPFGLWALVHVGKNT